MRIPATLGGVLRTSENDFWHALRKPILCCVEVGIGMLCHWTSILRTPMYEASVPTEPLCVKMYTPQSTRRVKKSEKKRDAV